MRFCLLPLPEGNTFYRRFAGYRPLPVAQMQLRRFSIAAASFHAPDGGAVEVQGLFEPASQDSEDGSVQPVNRQPLGGP